MVIYYCCFFGKVITFDEGYELLDVKSVDVGMRFGIEARFEEGNRGEFFGKVFALEIVFEEGLVGKTSFEACFDEIFLACLHTKVVL